jgi:hypothetical protein
MTCVNIRRAERGIACKALVRRGSTSMRRIEINLSDPFEEVLTCVLSLPSGTRGIAGNGSCDDKEFKQIIRELYEAANGRQVETRFGWIAIAPPVADFLKARPYYVATQIDLLIEAATRIIAGPPPSDVGIVAFETGSRGSPEPSSAHDDVRLKRNGERSKHRVPLIERIGPRLTMAAPN